MSDTDYDVEAVKKEYVGKVLRTSVGRYPVEYDPIRRHCHMAHDLNPLFLDPEFAKNEGPYGGVISPPVFIGYFAGGGIWPPGPNFPTKDGSKPRVSAGVPTPGDLGINMGVEYEFLIPARVGDKLKSVSKVADVFVKPIRLDPEAVWVVTETTTTNQHDEVVMKFRNTVLIHRSPEQVAAQSTAAGH